MSDEKGNKGHDSRWASRPRGFESHSRRQLTGALMDQFKFHKDTYVYQRSFSEGMENRSYFTLPSRPRVITRLSILVACFGTVGVLLSIIPLSLWYFVSRIHTSGIGILITGVISEIFLIAGVILLGIGLLTLFLGYGLWTGKRWAYPLGIGIGTITVLAAFAQFADGSVLGIFDFITGVWTLYLLMKPEVKAYFERYQKIFRIPQLSRETSLLSDN